MTAQHPYVVILAASDNHQLANLTRALYGEEVPKQFAVFAGQRSLLQQAIERASALTTLDRVHVVVTREHESLARSQLAGVPTVNLVVAPCDLDTAPSLLLALARIGDRASATERVVVMPSDHYVANPDALMEVVGGTARPGLRDRLALVGATPTEPEGEHAWILRGSRLGRTGAFAIAGLSEPSSDPDEKWRNGALWNTSITAGPMRAFWGLAANFLPRHVAALDRVIACGAELAAIDAADLAPASANLHRDVLARARSLAVVAADGTGWSDWGTPRCVFASLAGTPSHDLLVDRIRGRAA